MNPLTVKGVPFRTEGLSPASLEYLEAKSRRATRRALQQRRISQRIINALLPRDYRRVEVETLVSGKILVVGCAGGIETLGLSAVGIDVDLPAIDIAATKSVHVILDDVDV